MKIEIETSVYNERCCGKPSERDSFGFTAQERETIVDLWADRSRSDDKKTWVRLSDMLHGIYIWHYFDNTGLPETLTFLAAIAYERRNIGCKQ